MRVKVATHETQRFVLCVSLLAFLFCGVSLRLIILAKAQKTQNFHQPLPTSPAPFVLDRNGVIMAGNLQTFSVYAVPAAIVNKKQTAKMLAQFLKLDSHRLLAKLNKNNSFIWIQRHISPRQRHMILSLGLPGVFFKKDFKRFYPHYRLFSHQMGMRDIDGKGLCGFEKESARQAANLSTSLDIRLQYALREQLKHALKDFQAKAGNAIVMDLKTGEILAMVSLPDFNLNTPKMASNSELFDRNLRGVYEFGSVLKIYNTAMALESGTANLSTSFDVSQPLRIGRFAIKDFKQTAGSLNMRDAFLRSSNIAHAKMALLAGGLHQRSFFEKAGLLSSLYVDRNRTATPLLPTKWSQTTIATAAYGYGLAITPLHLITGVGKITTASNIIPTLYRKRNNQTFEKILSARTQKTINHLLRQTVLLGQARKASVPLYAIGAKTGTSNLLDKQGRYKQKNNLVSCIGVYPADSPRYIALVSLESPTNLSQTHGFATAGWIAAPTLKKIFTRILPLIGIVPRQGN